MRSPASTPRCITSARSTCRRSTSTCARTRSTATGPTAFAGVDADEVFITAGAQLKPFAAFRDSPEVDTFVLPEVEGVIASFTPASGAKCERCWRVLPEVGRNHRHPQLCVRCSDAVEHIAAAE